jgi:tetratricopeptide (TPR) repeat protein
MKSLPITLILLFVSAITTFAQIESDRNKGIELYRQGEYEKAIEILQNRVQAEEKDRLAWLYLGASFVKLKKDNDAVNAFRRTNVIYKNNLPVYEKELKIISQPRPAYAKSALKNETKGEVILAVEFQADGKIGFIFPFQTLPDGLTEKAVEAVKKIKFETAIIAGKPVTVVKVLSYHFSYY